MSSKGQIVIPKEMRTNIKEGDKLLAIKKDDWIIFKRIQDTEKNFEEEFNRLKNPQIAKEIKESLKAFKEGKTKVFPV